MPPFTIGQIAFVVGNRDYQKRPALVEAHLVLGASRLRVFLGANGEVSLPDTVPDVALRHAVAAEFRTLALAQLGAAWHARTAAEAEATP